MSPVGEPHMTLQSFYRIQFSAGQADHYPIALFDHVVIFNGLANITTQPLLQLIAFSLLLFGYFSHLNTSTYVGITDFPGLESRVL